MEKKKNLGFGFRGWMLILYQAIAFFTFTVFTKFPMNILADMYGGAKTISTIYTVATIVGIVVQLVFTRFIGKIKSIKLLGAIFGGITLILALGIMTIPMSNPVLYQICFALVTLFSNVNATFAVSILVGQWFPRRKGTIMGIATLAFPITNALIGFFAESVFKKGFPDVFGAFLPFFIVSVIGFIIGMIFIKDYPEQVGAFRDNDKSFTPEIAKAMMEEEIENKKTSVWNALNTFKSRDFWFITIPCGALLMCSVGMMTQTAAVLNSYADGIAPLGGYTGVMFIAAAIACVGSWLMGVIDTKIGTRKAIIISVVMMLVSGIIGLFKGVVPMLIAFFLLCVFEGAASNFTVSAAAQYWRREDFPNVFSCLNPIANILQAFGPMMVAATVFSATGYTLTYGIFAGIAVVSLVLMLLFSPKHVKAVDDKYREKAGKALDDALVGRK